MAGLFSWVLVVFRCLSEHGGSILCKQEDYSLGCFSNQPYAQQALAPNSGGLPLQGWGFVLQQMSKVAFLFGATQAHTWWALEKSQTFQDSLWYHKVHISLEATTSCPYAGSFQDFRAGKTHLLGLHSSSFHYHVFFPRTISAAVSLRTL